MCLKNHLLSVLKFMPHCSKEYFRARIAGRVPVYCWHSPVKWLCMTQIWSGFNDFYFWAEPLFKHVVDLPSYFGRDE